LVHFSFFPSNARPAPTPLLDSFLCFELPPLRCLLLLFRESTASARLCLAEARAHCQPLPRALPLSAAQCLARRDGEEER